MEIVISLDRVVESSVDFPRLLNFDGAHEVFLFSLGFNSSDFNGCNRLKAYLWTLNGE